MCEIVVLSVSIAYITVLLVARPIVQHIKGGNL